MNLGGLLALYEFNDDYQMPSTNVLQGTCSSIPQPIIKTTNSTLLNMWTSGIHGNGMSFYDASYIGKEFLNFKKTKPIMSVTIKNNFYIFLYFKI